jgi:hypothetical protein
MAKMLPKTPFQLNGGCFCSAIRYTISVPELSERREIPKFGATPDRLLTPLNEVNERMPIVTLDHCNSCRRVPGVILDSWVICPPSWVEFTLQPRISSLESPDEKEPFKVEALAYLMEATSWPERTYITHFKSSECSNRTFCGKCGTHLTFWFDGPKSPLRQALGDFFDIATGTLDKESVEIEGFSPIMQMWADDGINWVTKLVNEGKKGLLDDIADNLAQLKVEEMKK